MGTIEIALLLAAGVVLAVVIIFFLLRRATASASSSNPEGVDHVGNISQVVAQNDALAGLSSAEKGEPWDGVPRVEIDRYGKDF